MINYTETLREHHLKATPQRLEIANALHLYGHVSIEKLYEILQQKFSSISLATIYKNITLMMENSFIQEVKIPNTKSVYELTKKTHSHVVCQECGDVEDIKLDISEITKNAVDISHFNITKTDLVFSGLCTKCQ